jgi:hypothetical protein
MKLVVLALACSLAAVVSLSAHAASKGGPPCTAKTGKFNGKHFFFLCGPATATVHTGGKTYTFHSGYCKQSKTGGSSVELFLGTLAPLLTGNAGKPLFHMLINNPDGTVSASYGGKRIVNSLATINGRAKGTFKSLIGPSFTGSWNCHGIFQVQ